MKEDEGGGIIGYCARLDLRMIEHMQVYVDLDCSLFALDLSFLVRYI